MSRESETELKSAGQVRYAESLRRWFLAFLGILFVGVAALGVILPGLPTTIFLIIAAYLFTRSCPRLEQLLIRNRFFAAFHPYLDGTITMPWRAKFLTMAVMWSFIAASCVLLFISGSWPVMLISTIPLAGIVGTWFIANHGPSKN